MVIIFFFFLSNFYGAKSIENVFFMGLRNLLLFSSKVLGILFGIFLGSLGAYSDNLEFSIVEKY